ncbi:MAG: hypothetical protein V1909_06060 [Candidatus Micrarchaeota archaeon]
MKLVAFLLALVLLFGCSAPLPEKAVEKPLSDDSEVRIIVGENYSLGEPIAFQLKTSNYSISFLNRSGGYSIGAYPSVWICKKTNESCENVEYRQMADFSTCESGAVSMWVLPQSTEKKDVFPAEFYGLLLRWDQREWKEQIVGCGSGFASIRKAELVQKGEYSITFVYWVSWEGNPRSVSADFKIT